MGLKESFLELLSNDGIEAEWLSRVVPEIADLPSPGTVEESTLSIATYCDNCNKILQLYEGVPLLEFSLRAGQLSSAAQAIALSGLERNPVATGASPGSQWSWFLGVPGWPQDVLYEQFRGIGGNFFGDDTSDIYDALGTWFQAVKAWLISIGAQISAAEEAYIAGEEYVLELDAGTPPVIVVPAPIDADRPSFLWQIAKWIGLISGNVWFPLIIEIAKYLLRRASHGEALSPLLKTLRKALLLKDGDIDQGMGDYTPILLMMVERAIHIIFTNTGINAGVEPTWWEEYDLD